MSGPMPLQLVLPPRLRGGITANLRANCVPQHLLVAIAQASGGPRAGDEPQAAVLPTVVPHSQNWNHMEPLLYTSTVSWVIAWKN